MFDDRATIFENRLCLDLVYLVPTCASRRACNALHRCNGPPRLTVTQIKQKFATAMLSRTLDN